MDVGYDNVPYADTSDRSMMGTLSEPARQLEDAGFT